MQTNSRRSFLCALSVMPLAAPVLTAPAQASREDQADALWWRWVERSHFINSDHDMSDEEADLVMDEIGDIERQIASGPPSYGAVAALALAEIQFGTIGKHDTIADNDPASDLQRWIRLLPLLRPVVGGSIGRAVANLLDYPDRSVTECMFGHLSQEV